MHQALYRKWRPQTFDDVCGQEHITSILRYEVEHRAFSHAYLFCGSRGTGKTTCAKILAKAVNCEAPVNGSPCGRCASCVAIDSGATTDVLEMDAASNNGVEDIRDIRDEVVYPPANLRYRVYIIDEVHMLSVNAFNALLKTLEEPPEYVVFILATTELHKLLPTIISRCQRFDFRRISTDALMGRLSHIAKEEGITLHTDAARLLAKLAQGGMRDAISLLELCAGGQREVNVQTVEDAVGLTGRDQVLRVANAIVERRYDHLFGQIDEVVRSAKDLSVFWQDLIGLYRDVLVLKTAENPTAYLDLTDHEAAELTALAKKLPKERVLYHCKLLEDAMFAMQKANAVKRVVAEMTLIRMCDEALDTSTEALLSRIAALEERMTLGGTAVPAPATTPAPVPTEAPREVERPTASAPRPTPAIRQPQPKTAAPAPAAPQVGASAAPQRPAPAPVPSQEGIAKRILRPLRNWMEIVERVGRSSPMAASFIGSARAFTTEDGCVVVQFENSFNLQMMEQGEFYDRLRSAVSAVLRREVADKQLLLEVAGKAAKASIIDEILEASEED